MTGIFKGAGQKDVGLNTPVSFYKDIISILPYQFLTKL